MDDERIAKLVLQGKVEGTGRRGKPRTTWMSAVVEERTWISLHREKELAQDRKKWRKIVQNVGAHVRPTRLKINYALSEHLFRQGAQEEEEEDS